MKPAIKKLLFNFKDILGNFEYALISEDEDKARRLFKKMQDAFKRLETGFSFYLSTNLKEK